MNIMPRKIITDELKQEIIDFYLESPKTYQDIRDKYHLSLPTIGKILKDVPKYPKAKIYNPQLDEHFFETINTEEKAYFLGLIITDGNVFIKDDKSNRQASISITLNLEDEYMLDNFKNILHSNTNIGHDGRGCGQIAVRSNIMAEDLKKYGIVPCKTLSTYLPDIDKKYLPHLIRGIFDGDGSIMFKKHNIKYLHSISFCGSHQLMEDLVDIFQQYLTLKTIPQVYDYHDKHLSDLKLQNYHDIVALGNWMYKDATIYLKRKKDVYQSILTHLNGNTELTN